MIYTANYIVQDTLGDGIRIGPVAPPVNNTDAATKRYVDQSIPVPVTYQAPLSLDVPTNTVSVSFASANAYTDLSVADAKQYTDDRIADTIQANTLTFSEPLQLDVPTNTVSIAPASATADGYVTAGTQTLSSGKKFTENLSVVSQDGTKEVAIQVDADGVTTITNPDVVALATPMWDDLNVLSAIRFTGTGMSLVDFISLAPIGGGVIQQLAFPGNMATTVMFTVQTPHSMMPNSDMRPHIHWSTTVSMAGQNARFRLDWVIRAIDGVYSTASHAYTDMIDITTVTPYKHNKTSFVARVPDLGVTTHSRVIVGQLSRLADAVEDNFTGNIFLLGFDFHILKNLINGDMYP